MGEPESTERVYSFAKHCSPSPELAKAEINIHRVRYFESKRGGVQGLEKGKSELLGLHFFMSYTVEDNPAPETMTQIALRIAEHPLLKDFAVFGANHFDRRHKHTHFFVSAYSVEGKPRKLRMSRCDYNEIRRFANKLCYEHGLSFIDLPTLRWKQPAYSAWVDHVIEEGKVSVHHEKEEHKKYRKQKLNTRSLYYKHMKEAEEVAAQEYRMMTEQQREKKDFEERYCYFPGEDKGKRCRVSGDPKQRFYVVERKDCDGYLRTPLELAVRFILVVAKNEGNYIKQQHTPTWLNFHVKVDKDIQGLYDYMCTARELRVDSPHEISGRIADVGKQMNALKREKARHKKSIEKHEEIMAAYMTYIEVKDAVEGVEEPKPIDLQIYREAYAILTHNQILDADAYRELCRRRDFEKQKVVDYDRRMPELNKQYRQLKRLEAIASNPPKMLNEIYGFSKLAYQRAEERNREIAKQNRNVENEKIY